MPTIRAMTTVSFELPESLAAALSRGWGDLSVAAKEAFAIESYRSGRISLGYLAQLLGLSGVIEAGQWLAARGVDMNYSLADLEADRATLQSLLSVRL